MSKKSDSFSRQKGTSKSRKATMTSRSQLSQGRKLLLNASGAKSLHERAQNSHARIWKKQEIKNFFSVEYLEEQLERADRHSLWLRLTLKGGKCGESNVT